MARKEMERVFLDSFFRRVGWGVIEITAREEPDFVVRTADGVIGIELTQILKDASQRGGSKKKAGEASTSRFLRKLADEYYRLDDRPINLKAYFGEPPDPAALSELTNRVRQAVPEAEWETSQIELETLSGARTRFYIRRLPSSCDAYCRWTPVNNSVGWVRALDPSVISTRIHAKAKRLASYRQVVDRVCLLLVVDRTRESGMFSWNPSTLTVPSLGFDAVYLYLHPLEVFQVA